MHAAHVVSTYRYMYIQVYVHAGICTCRYMYIQVHVHADTYSWSYAIHNSHLLMGWSFWLIYRLK